MQLDLSLCSPIAEPSQCLHAATVFRRCGPHVGEYCSRCGANIRGRGVWIPFAEVRATGVDPSSLPTLESLQAAIAAWQSTLFPAEEQPQ